MATCDVCNRPLTDPESIARGRGPVCSGGRCLSALSVRQPDAAQGVLWAVQLALGLSSSPAPSVTTDAPRERPTPVQLALDLPPKKRPG